MSPARDKHRLEPTVENVDLLFERLPELLAESEHQHKEEFEPEPLLWFAVTPRWTLALAAATDFPLRSRAGPARRSEAGKKFDSIESLFEGLVAASRVRRFQSPLPDEQTPERISYILVESERARVMREQMGSPKQLEHLWRTTALIGERIKSRGRSAGASDLLLDWSDIAIHAESPERISVEFDALVKDSSDAAHIQRLMDAARCLEPLLVASGDSSLTLALQRASRRLELLRRREDDLRQINYFLPRQEQINALGELMGDDHKHWVLHLVGAGGVGKTMLMRYLSTHFAEERHLAVARIDFDYFNPDYPRLAPGLLLWAFVQEFSAYDRTGRATRLFDEADRILGKFHEILKLSETARNGDSPLENPYFRRAVQLYGQGLKCLPNRILLVLDTCEELARIRPDGTVPESIGDTFRILVMLHDEVEELRVVMSGRRPLASAGFGWTCVAPELPPREFLRLHEIRGFSHAEARVFLTAKSTVSEHLIEPIIQHCPDIGKVIDVRWIDPAKAPAEIPRCNPTELRRDADWASEDPSLTPEQIKFESNTQYVERRILGRLRYEPLERLMPAIALLGHFDEAPLRQVAGTDDRTLEMLLAKLRQQEWITIRRMSYQADEVRIVYDVESVVRRKLLEYYEQSGDALRGCQRKMADFLEKETLSRDLQTLDWSYLDATRSVLERDPRLNRAAKWWSRIEARVFNERGFAWMDSIASFINIPDGTTPDLLSTSPESESDPGLRISASRVSIRAAILASSAGALVRKGNRRGLLDLWSEVSHYVPSHPIPRMRKKLRLRAMAGIVAAQGGLSDQTMKDDFWQQFHDLPQRWFDTETAAGIVAAAEALVEVLEEDWRPVQKAIGGTEYDEGSQTLWMAEYNKVFTRAAELFENVNRLRGRISIAVMKGHLRRMKTDSSLEALSAFTDTLLFRIVTMFPILCRDRLSSGVADWSYSLANRLLELPENLDDRFLSDWRCPDDFRARLFLEYLRLLPTNRAKPDSEPGGAALGVVSDLLSQATSDTIDMDRLRSATLRLQLASSPVPPYPKVSPELLDQLIEKLVREYQEQLPPSQQSQLARCNAHRWVPPLFASVAEALSARGLVEDAIKLLRRVTADSSSFHEETRRAAERAYLQIVRRFRLLEIGEGQIECLRASTDLKDETLIWAIEGLGALQGQKPPLGNLSGSRNHALWRAQVALNDEQRARLLEAWPKFAKEQIKDPNLALDEIERRTLSHA